MELNDKDNGNITFLNVPSDQIMIMNTKKSPSVVIQIEDDHEEASLRFVRICAQGNVRKVKKLLELKTTFKNQLLLAHLDQSMNFIWACAEGKVQKVKTLIKSKSIAFNVTDDDGRTGFHHACRHGYFQVVKMLVEQSHDLGLDLNKAEKNGMTPFHSACYNKHDKIVDFLINSVPKVNINLKDSIGQSGLGLYFRKVCEKGDVKNLEKLLKLEEKIDFNEPDTHGQTGLFWACLKGQFQVVKLLVEQSHDLGLDLNKAEKNGMTPFHTACLNQHAKVVHFLMESEDKYGINLSLLDQNGITGFGYLTEKDADEVIKLTSQSNENDQNHEEEMMRCSWRDNLGGEAE